MGVNSNRVDYFVCHGTTTTIKIQGDIPMPPLEIHKVQLPPEHTTLQKLRHRLSEIVFPDDPLYRFKNQTWFMKLLLALQYLFPIFQWALDYNLTLLCSHIVSGITIASLAIPQVTKTKLFTFLMHAYHLCAKSFCRILLYKLYKFHRKQFIFEEYKLIYHGMRLPQNLKFISSLQGINYAKLANLPPIVGLYSSFVPPLIYFLLGSSRHLGVGPVSIASLVMGSMLSETVSYTQDSILYLKLAFTATFFTGLVQSSLGILRLGFVIDFLSKPMLVGFMASAAIIVSLQ